MDKIKTNYEDYKLLIDLYYKLEERIHQLEKTLTFATNMRAEIEWQYEEKMKKLGLEVIK